MARRTRPLFGKYEMCCGRVMGGFQCKTDRNGNRHRYYRFCGGCDWLCADDREGWRDENPPCRCGKPSRKQHERSVKHFTYRCLRERCKGPRGYHVRSRG
ncbi:hypothetical protein BDV34DRAFT_203988 [Aspergillus parasiticus]|uniref:Uncharacterized protein n=1 Tax=Aspergillus parasiticus TaxID=5067 RepID=A0A5N6D787_ASPPA|nr:hypothetical protein BDV34DRAFT_203988 [Aspergillus parasiticus]